MHIMRPHPLFFAALALVTATCAIADVVPSLDRFLPANLPGWRAEKIDPMGDHGIMTDRYYKGAGESFLNVTILRSRANNAFGVPDLAKARLGELPEAGGFASLVDVGGGRKALLTFQKSGPGGTLLMVAGKCTVTVRGSQVSAAQLSATGRGFDLAALATVCQ